MRILKSNTSSAAVVEPLPPPNHHDQATAPTSSAIGTYQRSPWHSPVPYLFGGLAATLGLIAFALLILVCSYWKISLSGSGHHDDNEEEMETKKKQEKIIVYEEQFVVILAGDDKPTCLATPAMTASCTLDSINIISDHESSTSGLNKGNEKQQSNEEEEEIESSTDQGSHSTSSP